MCSAKNTRQWKSKKELIDWNSSSACIWTSNTPSWLPCVGKRSRLPQLYFGKNRRTLLLLRDYQQWNTPTQSLCPSVHNQTPCNGPYRRWPTLRNNYDTKCNLAVKNNTFTSITTDNTMLTTPGTAPNATWPMYWYLNFSFRNSYKATKALEFIDTEFTSLT